MKFSSRPTWYAGAFLALNVLLFGFLLATLREPALYRFWRAPLGGGDAILFEDASGMLAGADAVRENGERFSWDYLLAKDNPYNYPRVWAVGGAWLGLGVAQRVSVGLVLAAVLLGCQCWLLRPRDARSLAVATAVLFSSANLLLLERGNNDIVVLALVTAATAGLAARGVAGQVAGGGLLLLAGGLKLYPAAAVMAVPRPRGRAGWAVAAGLLALFGLYLLATRTDLANVSARTPRFYQGSYGGLTFASFVGHSQEFSGLAARAGWDLSAPGRRAALEGAARGVSILAMLGLGGLALWGGMRSAARWTAEPPPGVDGTRFLAGAAIYAGTFGLGSNWDYRLALLSLTVPMLNRWLGGGDPARRRWAAGALGLVLFCLWGFVAPHAAWALALWQGATWTLFGVLTFLLGTLLPANFARRPSSGHVRAVRP